MTTFGSYSEAALQLPADAKWSCSFGYPGEGGYCEYFRDAQGHRFIIGNGPYDAIRPFEWSIKTEGQP